MSLEAPEINILAPSEQTAAPDEVALAFARAKQQLYEMTAGESFQQACAAEGIDGYGFDDPAYWHFVAKKVSSFAAKVRAQRGDSLSLSALELLASTPEYLFA